MKATKALRWFFIVVLLLGGAAYVWEKYSRLHRSDKSVKATDEAKKTPDGSFGKTTLSEKIGALSTIKYDRKRLDAALATGSTADWMPILGELKNSKYRREDAIAILTSLLAHADMRVRYQAAQQLSYLGSAAGFPILRDMIAAGARGEGISPELVLFAAQTLHQYRQIIDKDMLYAVYQRNKSAELLPLLMLQQVPQLRALVRERRLANQLGYSTESIAAYLNMADAESIQSYKALLNAYPKAQLLADWALYRATGEKIYLSSLIAIAREGAGLIPGAHGVSSTTAADAIRYLQITVVPDSTETLQEIVEQGVRHPDVGTLNFGRALGALFYLHQDYSYVDQFVLNYLQKNISASGVDQNLIMQIAAARNTPELASAAKIFNSETYERYFIELQGHPVESWIGEYVSLIPVDIAPPLK